MGMLKFAVPDEQALVAGLFGKRWRREPSPSLCLARVTPHDRVDSKLAKLRGDGEQGGRAAHTDLPRSWTTRGRLPACGTTGLGTGVR